MRADPQDADSYLVFDVISQRLVRHDSLGIEPALFQHQLPANSGYSDDPQCMKVCPASTYSKRPDGIVVQDHDKCIGCRMCIMACPYNAPVFDPQEGKTSKCNLCAERLDEGLLPRCVESCPAGVLLFGEIEELRKLHITDWASLEARYHLPDHRISGPNIVIIPADK